MRALPLLILAGSLAPATIAIASQPEEKRQRSGQFVKETASPRAATSRRRESKSSPITKLLSSERISPTSNPPPPPFVLQNEDNLKSTACDLQSLASKSGSAFVEGIQAMPSSCLNGLFSRSALSIRATILSAANMIKIAAETTDRSKSYAPPDELLRKYFIFLRAGYYNHFHNSEDMDWSDSTQKRKVDDAFIAALTAFADNRFFFEVSNDHALALTEMLLGIDALQRQDLFIPMYKQFLRNFSSEYLNHVDMGRAANAVFTGIFRGHHSEEYRKLARDDAELITVLRDFALTDWALDSSMSYLLGNASLELTRFLQYDQGTVYEPAVRAVRRVLNRYELTGPGAIVNIPALKLIIHFNQCGTFDLCSTLDNIDDLMMEILTVRYECDEPAVVIRAQDLDEEVLAEGCKELVDIEAVFHEELATRRQPVSEDYNDVLEIVIFASKRMYDLYSNLFFGNSTDNGGIYLEGDPSDTSNVARALLYVNSSGELFNFEHEYVHYLDGRYNLHGSFADYRINSRKLVWWAEGLAEHLSSTRISLPIRISDDDPSLSNVLSVTYSDSSDLVYGWSQAAVMFFFERRSIDVSKLLSYTRAGAYEKYFNHVENVISRNYDQEFSEWLNSTYCFGDPTFTVYSYISRVSVGSMDRRSGSDGYDTGYERVRIHSGSQQTLEVEVDVIIAVNNDRNFVRAWIDWNEDQVFADDEQIMNREVTLSDSAVQVAQSFEVPSDVSGLRQMRVKVNYDDPSPGADGRACGTFESGEVEEYKLEVIGLEPPAELVATPGDGRATLRWRNPSNNAITGYAVRRATNAAAFTGATPPDWVAISGSGAETVEHVVEGLTNGTRYYFQLRATSADRVGPTADATVRLATSPASEVTFAAALRTAVAKAAGRESGEPLTRLDVARVRELRAASSEIADLAGLEHAINLASLDLTNNSISGLAALSNLDGLRILRLGGNGLDDISALSGLTSLEELWLNDNRVSDLRPLTDLRSLAWLEVARNEVRDLPALSGMTALNRLRLDGNRVADVSALAQSGLGEGSVVGLRGNPLSTASIEQHLPTLRAAGVAVLAGRPVPLFPSASDEERQGFVRVTNRSDEAGEVLIHAVDDAGTRFDPVRLSIGAGESEHFNSDDLEQGNAAKGLSGGVGAPTRGHWRLALLSTLDIEVLAYLRTPDGFLTSVHDMLRRDDGAGTLAAPIFNPGSNTRQRSSLRLMNPGGVEEAVAVLGVDDGGSGGDRAVELAVPAGGATTMTAVALEAGLGYEAGLGDGAGKWRLVVNARWPVEAASLLTSPTGHVTNLSAHAAADANGVWRLPFYPASANASGWQGFARVINRGSRAGEATIVAVDDSGMRTDSVTLALNGGQTVHFNSDDLERGNAAKGLPTGVGAPARGDWRLELTSALDVSVTSYIRTSDGFLTSMHDVAPTASTDGGERRVVIFNPGSNQRQVSLLRLINDGDAAAAVTVTGIDDAGRPGGEARATVPAGEALTLTAQELESGADTFEGALGDGQGKWRLTVASDAPVSVVSLLRSPTGHLTNLSRTSR